MRVREIEYLQKKQEPNEKRNGAANAIRKRRTENDINTKIKIVRNAGEKRAMRKQILFSSIASIICSLRAGTKLQTRVLNAA